MDPFVFREYEAPAISNLKDLNWTREAPVLSTSTSANRHRPPHPCRGPRSLFSLALEKAAENIQDFEDDYLASLPKSDWIRLMWEYLDLRKGQLSFDVWKKFSQHLPRRGHKRPPLLQQFYASITQPTAASFAVYTQPLQTTATFDFVTHLKIAGPCQIAARDLMVLPGMSNLGVLEIAEPWSSDQPFPRVDDRMIKAWSCYDNPFPQLLVLCMSSIDSFTEECVRYLHKFPLLALLEVFARRQHWRRRLRSGADDPAHRYWARCDAADTRRKSTASCHPEHPLPCRASPSTTDSHECLTHNIANNPFVRASDEKVLWGCWTYTTVQRLLRNAAVKARLVTISNINHNNRASQATVASTAARALLSSTLDQHGCEPTLPFASLVLGSESGAMERPEDGNVPGMARIVFWRRSLVPGPDAARVEVPSSERFAFAPSEKAARKTSSLETRPLKRRRLGAIGDMLGDFQC
ncbi:hypothetical protein BD289DRAFT_479821 [Coniella lustricola]|uniref:Uncharacterized protein n=1 Tax=Coniella lustricola TaxID=2025994 RepID=A0A2T3AHG8_9PEZI|nr:hypothetical protein BD289DRAFT_479821 [Coniella lustricola]